MPWGDTLTMPETLIGEMVSTHPEEVLQWRREAFLHLKFPVATARWLAKTRIDIRQMEKLLESGCEHALAIKILEGTWYAGEDTEPYIQLKQPEPVEEDDDE